jgi:hypothetical protein
MENIEEIWKTCTNYDMYEVSNLGKVRNKNTTGKVFLKAVVAIIYYLCYNLITKLKKSNALYCKFGRIN